MLVAGNGGAARGAVFALMDAGAKVTITGRNFDNVKSLARSTGAEAVSCDELGDAYFDAFVHATPIGMHPNDDACFFPERFPPMSCSTWFTIQRRRLLLRRAEEQGREVVPGLEMFMEQAARQFEIFTGEPAPRPAMEKAAIEALGLSS